MEENTKPTTTENDDVEAHGNMERPVERPVEANTEAPDFEAHSFAEKPVE